VHLFARLDRVVEVLVLDKRKVALDLHTRCVAKRTKNVFEVCRARALGVEADHEEGGRGVVLGRLLPLLLPPFYHSIASREFYLEVFQLPQTYHGQRQRQRQRQEPQTEAQIGAQTQEVSVQRRTAQVRHAYTAGYPTPPTH